MERSRKSQIPKDDINETTMALDSEGTQVGLLESLVKGGKDFDKLAESEG